MQIKMATSGAIPPPASASSSAMTAAASNLMLPDTKITVLMQDLIQADGDDIRASVARALREAVETELRDYLGSQSNASSGAIQQDRYGAQLSSRVMTYLNSELQRLLSSEIAGERLAGIAALHEFIDLRGEPYRVKVQRTYNGLRVILGKVWDVQTSRQAAKALGHLAELGGVLTNRSVEAELARALERLRDTHGQGAVPSASRAIACMVLHELADSVPALVYARRNELVRTIWNGATDSSLEVQQEANTALGSFLNVVCLREASEAVRVVDTLVEQILVWLHSSQATPEQIYGSLRAMGELLRNSFAREHLKDRFNQLCDVTLGFRDHPEKLIKRAVASVIPLLASSNPEAFASQDTGNLGIAFHFLAGCIWNNIETSECFLSLGKTCIAVGAAFDEFIIESLDLAYGTISGEAPGGGKSTAVADALTCVGLLMQSIQNPSVEVTRKVYALLAPMFSSGLSMELVSALNSISSAITSLSILIQEKLLDAAAKDLGVSVEEKGHAPTSKGATTDRNKQKVSMALSAVGSYDFRGLDSSRLCAFVRDCVIDYVESRQTRVRKAATRACTRLLSSAALSSLAKESGHGKHTRIGDPHRISPPSTAASVATMAGREPLTSRQTGESLDTLTRNMPISSTSTSSQPSAGTALVSTPAIKRLRSDVYSLLIKILPIAVADPDGEIRLTALQGLGSAGFEGYLAQPECLKKLLLCLHDEKLSVREATVCLVGQLSSKNPAHSLPALRKFLMELMVVLRCEGDALRRQQSHAAKLLSLLIRDAPRLVRPYVQPILSVLIDRLRDARNMGDTEAATPVLTAVGDLAGRSQCDMRPFFDDLLPLIVGCLQVQSAEPEFKKAALQALSRLVKNTGGVIEPYRRFPSLLSSLLSSLRFEVDPAVRLEVEILLGTLGAVNPNDIGYLSAAKRGGGSSGGIGVAHITGMDQGHTADSAVFIGGQSSQETGGWGARVTASVPAFDKDIVSNGMDALTTNEEKQRNVDDSNIGGGGGGGGAGGGAGGGLHNGHQQTANPMGDEKSNMSVEAITSSIEKRRQPLWAQEELKTVSLVMRLSHPFTAHSEFFPSAALDALHRILADRRLAHYHREAVGAIVSTVHTLGPKCVSFLPAILPRLMWLLRPGEDNGTRDPDFKEYVFKRLGEVVAVARQHTRPYVGDILLLIREYWDSGPQLLRPVLELTEKLCIALGDEFQPMIPRLLPAMLAVLVSDRARKREPTVQVLRAFETFGSELDDYVTLILPSVLRVAEDRAIPNTVRKEAMVTLRRLVEVLPVADLGSCLVHPLARVASQADMKDLFIQALNSLVAVALQIRKEFALFAPTVAFAIQSNALVHSQDASVREVFAILAACGVNIGYMLPGPINDSMKLRIAEWQRRFASNDLGMLNKAGSISSQAIQSAASSQQMATDKRRIHVNQRSLRRAWEVGRRHTREDWEEWLQTLGSALFRESGSPALRSCARLAEVYQPLARELFNAAFLSCWSELSSATQAGLVGAVETALLSGSLPLDALQTLLSLAEFMEHDEKPLPIDVRRLAAMACRCGAYAKALHYKEAEYIQDPAAAIAGDDGLISIYDNLGQQESAVGALIDAERRFGVRRREEWFEKLQRWDEALAAYERQIARTSEEKEKTRSGGGGVGGHTNQDHVSLTKTDAPPSILDIGKLKSSSTAKVALAVGGGATAGGASQEPVRSDDPDISIAVGKETSASAASGQAGINSANSTSSHSTGNADPAVSEWDLKIGRIRCLHELGEWRRMDQLVREAWNESKSNTDIRVRLANAGAATVALNLSRWQDFAERLQFVSDDTFNGAFYRTLLAVHESKYDLAKTLVGKARIVLDTGLTARVAEGYPRAYSEVLNAQLLAEMEEAIEYLRDEALYGPSMKEKTHLAITWRSRLSGCRHDHDTWYRTLMLRSRVLEPHENISEFLEFATLCRKAKRLPMAAEALRMVLPEKSIVAAEDDLRRMLLQESSKSNAPFDPIEVTRLEKWNPDIALEEADPRVTYSFLNHLWASGRLVDAYRALKVRAPMYAIEDYRGTGSVRVIDRVLMGRYHLKLSEWAKHLYESGLSKGNSAFSENEIGPQVVLEHSRQATLLDPSWYKAWHTWAFLNAEAAQQTEASSASVASTRSARIVNAAVKAHVAAAVNGYFSAIRVGVHTRRTRIQDVLRILTLWFRYGGLSEVTEALSLGFATTDPDLWLEVVPQMIARLHAPLPEVQEGLKALLIRIGSAHPQALIYPLTVAAKSTNAVRQQAAQEILSALRIHSAALVEQAEMVSRELIRVAILWHEMWHENLEEASRLYFGEHNVDGMFEVLAPLHAMMDAGPETIRETAFHREFGRDLAEAAEWCRRYRASNREADLNQAWDLYYHVFRRINKQLPQLNTLELSQVSPKLLHARNLEIVVPGTYQVQHRGSDEPPLVTIAYFAPTLTVISSKQRPRRLVIYGSDGMEHAFLLKGHEDLRQDERVMQFFGLVNEVLTQASDSNANHLSITRFSVVPLSPNAGLIGWVPNCDTLHSLVRDFREQRKILLNVEHRLMLQMAPDYDNLPLLQKVEVFEYALANTTGMDIARVLWLKSRSAEIWLERRTNYIRSLATMSMVGYILGLGDRHPSNLMLERATGKILHIDFGDCFEVAMHREKYPERVPFRLTRMLVNALEVCGVEGYFRHTSDAVMTVLRREKASLMAMLEAFIHDPLINWRLLGDGTTGQNAQNPTKKNAALGVSVHAAVVDTYRPLMSETALEKRTASFRGTASRQLLESGNLSLTEVANMETIAEAGAGAGGNTAAGAAVAAAAVSTTGKSISQTLRSRLVKQVETDGVVDYVEAVNRRAVVAIQRVSNKLNGRDFDYDQILDVPAQVARLIEEATNVENLCQAFLGWCSFW